MNMRKEKQEQMLLATIFPASLWFFSYLSNYKLSEYHRLLGTIYIDLIPKRDSFFDRMSVNFQTSRLPTHGRT